MRFIVYNRNYEDDYDRVTSAVRLTRNRMDFEDMWVVESVDSGHEFYYATHEEAIDSIYEGSKRG